MSLGVELDCLSIGSITGGGGDGDTAIVEGTLLFTGGVVQYDTSIDGLLLPDGLVQIG